MLSNSMFTTYPPQKQAEIITKLMSLFKSNERAHGVGDVKGSKFNEDKNKWVPANIRLDKTKATEADWRAHLAGERFLGQGPLLDDGTVLYATLDVDKLPDSIGYEFDFMEEMGKITRSGIPLVVFRTKSGGLRPTLFFSEPIEAEFVIRRMKQIAAQLGYAGCEIFPKQNKLDVENGDYSSWIFMPFGPVGPVDQQGGMFPEQCCMNESGNPMDISDAVRYAERMRISREKFSILFIEEEKAKANGKANGKKKPGGKWTQDETWIQTIDTTFYGGPICLWAIAHMKCRVNQNNFLLSTAVFLKKKYPDNWEEVLTWVNGNVLDPFGNQDKLADLIKRLKHQDYEYGCNDEPMHSHCNSGACRRQPWGVGQGKGGIDHFELGMTIINREPRIFIVNVGEGRMMLDAHTLMNLQKYKETCVEHGVPFPNSMKRDEWENNVRKNTEEATIVEPSEILKTNADEWWAVQKFFSSRIPNMVRSQGEKYLEGRCGDYVRIKLKEEKLYFKWDWLRLFCERTLQLNGTRIENLKRFIYKEAEFNDRLKLRDWFRSTWSFRFNQFDPGAIDQWLHPDEEEKDDEQLDTSKNESPGAGEVR